MNPTSVGFGKEEKELLQRIAELEAQVARLSKSDNFTPASLMETSAAYRVLLETMTQGIVYQNPDGKIILMNPAAVRILGRTMDEFDGETTFGVDRDVLRDGRPYPRLEHPAMLAMRTG